MTFIICVCGGSGSGKTYISRAIHDNLPYDSAVLSYDYDAERLHFIAPEGRLEATLPLFDRFLHNPARTHLMRRLEDVGAAYFANDREGFYKALYEGRLLSREALLRYRKIALREGKEGPPLLWEER